MAFKIGFLKGIDNGDGTLRFSPLDAADRQALARLAYEFKLNQALYKSKVQQLEAAIALAAAVKAANEAIAALPDASELTIDDKAAVEEARAKVEAARKLGATDKDFPNLSKLADAEQKKLKNWAGQEEEASLAVAAAVVAVELLEIPNRRSLFRDLSRSVKRPSLSSSERIMRSHSMWITL